MRKPVGEAIAERLDEKTLKERCRAEGLSIEEAAEKYLVSLNKSRARLDRHRKKIPSLREPE